jgi:hypothetical protein
LLDVLRAAAEFGVFLAEAGELRLVRLDLLGRPLLPSLAQLELLPGVVQQLARDPDQLLQQRRNLGHAPRRRLGRELPAGPDELGGAGRVEVFGSVHGTAPSGAFAFNLRLSHRAGAETMLPVGS